MDQAFSQLFMEQDMVNNHCDEVKKLKKRKE